jgi:hypothetical protein
VTFAEKRPDPKPHPCALPHMPYAGSLVFTPPDRPVDLRLMLWCPKDLLRDGGTMW